MREFGGTLLQGFRDLNSAMLEQITPLLLTFDEMPNLERTFAPLAWAKRIVVVESGSTDGKNP